MQAHKVNSPLAKIHLGTGKRIVQTFSNRASVSFTRTNSGKRKRSAQSFDASGWLWVPKGQEIKYMGEKRKKALFLVCGNRLCRRSTEIQRHSFSVGHRRIANEDSLFPEKMKYTSLNEVVVREG